MSFIIYQIAVVIAMLGGITLVTIMGLDMLEVLPFNRNVGWAFIPLGLGAILAMLSFLLQTLGL